MTYRRAIWKGYPTVIRWRTLTWAEHRKISAYQAPAIARYMEAYQVCVVNGPDLATVPFGIAYWIGRMELEESPFGGQFKVLTGELDKARQWFQHDFLNAAQAVVAWTFRYTPEEIETWDADKLFKRLAQAEYIFNRPLIPADPEEKPDDGKNPKKRPMTARKQEQTERLNRVLARKQNPI